MRVWTRSPLSSGCTGPAQSDLAHTPSQHKLLPHTEAAAAASSVPSGRPDTLCRSASDCEDRKGQG